MYRYVEAVDAAAGWWLQLQGGGCSCRAVDAAAGRWMQLQGGGCSCRAVVAAAGRWMQLQGGGCSCRAVDAAAGWWLQLQGGGCSCRAVDAAAGRGGADGPCGCRRVWGRQGQSSSPWRRPSGLGRGLRVEAATLCWASMESIQNLGPLRRHARAGRQADVLRHAVCKDSCTQCCAKSTTPRSKPACFCCDHMGDRRLSGLELLGASPNALRWTYRPAYGSALSWLFQSWGMHRGVAEGCRNAVDPGAGTKPRHTAEWVQHTARRAVQRSTRVHRTQRTSAWGAWGHGAHGGMGEWGRMGAWGHGAHGGMGRMGRRGAWGAWGRGAHGGSLPPTIARPPIRSSVEPG